MRKITLVAAALASVMMFGLDTRAAQAAYGFGGFGLHVGGRNVHLDIGNPHGRYYRPSPQVNYRRSYSNPRWYGHGGRVHHDWHDTSHWDYNPGGYVPHGNHLDYLPPSRTWHQEGHFDVHRGSHHGRHR